MPFPLKFCQNNSTNAHISISYTTSSPLYPSVAQHCPKKTLKPCENPKVSSARNGVCSITKPKLKATRSSTLSSTLLYLSRIYHSQCLSFCRPKRRRFRLSLVEQIHGHFYSHVWPLLSNTHHFFFVIYALNAYFYDSLSFFFFSFYNLICLLMLILTNWPAIVKADSSYRL